MAATPDSDASSRNISPHQGIAVGVDASMLAPFEPERADATRNRTLLLAAAHKLVATHGAAAVTMDDVARAAGVGKGTVFRRFGSRAGLMLALIDHSETQLQQAFVYGPPPLGPGAAPLNRLIAYGRARLKLVDAHLDILLSADDASGVDRLNHPVRQVSALHVRSLLNGMGVTATPVIVEAVLAPLDPTVIDYLLSANNSIDAIADDFEEFVRSLQPR